MMRRGRGDFSVPRIDETSNALIQLFNILLEAVAKDSEKFRSDIAEAYNKLISTLASFVDFMCLDPYTRYLLESNLMGDIILSHLEHEEAIENNEAERKENWLKLSGRTKALIAIAIARCGRRSQIGLGYKDSVSPMRVEKV